VRVRAGVELRPCGYAHARVDSLADTSDEVSTEADQIDGDYRRSRAAVLED
jgi:hypothetical protein